MNRISIVGVVVMTAVIAYLAAAAEHADGAAAPIFGIKIYPGYRDWKLISVAHEAGNLNDIRAVLGNDIAIKSYREGKQFFPDGAVIARLSWNYVPSEENNKVFGQAQSFVPGDVPDWYQQFMEKDTKKYAATGGWGYSNFGKDLKPTTDQKTMYGCYVCHQAVAARDYVFTKYAP